MIQIYKSTNTNFEKNGDITLTPTSCVINSELNGAWELSLEHPIDSEGRWSYIEEECVIKVPSFLTDDQLFRIKTVDKSDAGISVKAEPIFMDSMNDCFLVDVRPTNKTGQQALDLMTAPNSKYSGTSNITKTATAYYEYKNLIEAINSDDENSFTSRWGGEILFDNFNVTINSEVGADNGVELLYGKNIPENGFKESIDTSGVITRIYPTAYNGRKPSGMLGRNIYVDSPLIDSYPTVHSATIMFEDVKFYLDASDDERKGLDDGDVYVCYNQAELDAVLEFRCEEEFKKGIDKPTVNIEADLVLLKNTDQYKDYAILEDVSLGDTIHCRHNRLDITTDARVISLEYDCLLKKVNSVELGDFTYNYFSDVSSAVNRIDSAIRSDGSVVAEQVKGFIDGAWAQLKLQNTVAQKQDVRAILFEDLDTKSSTFGALAIGTQGLQISKKRNEDDTDWVWTTALTSNGLIANIIVAGLLSDKQGKNYWNLDTGEFVITSGKLDIQVDNNYSLIELKGKSVEGDDLICTVSPGQLSIENETKGLTALMQGHLMGFYDGENPVFQATATALVWDGTSMRMYVDDDGFSIVFDNLDGGGQLNISRTNFHFETKNGIGFGCDKDSFYVSDDNDIIFSIGKDGSPHLINTYSGTVPCGDYTLHFDAGILTDIT